MMQILTIAILLSASTLITVAQDQPNSSADKSMILALESAWNQAEIHHDANAVAAIMSDNFISVDHHGNLQNKSQYLPASRTFPSSPRKSPIQPRLSTCMETLPSSPAPIEPKAPMVVSPSSIGAVLLIPG